MAQVGQLDAGSGDDDGDNSAFSDDDEAPKMMARVNNDSTQLLNIFPEEIWVLIAEKLEPEGMESLANASPFFRHLLLPKRVLFLFPSVWNILAVKYHEPHQNRRDDGDDQAYISYSDEEDDDDDEEEEDDDDGDDDDDFSEEEEEEDLEPWNPDAEGQMASDSSSDEEDEPNLQIDMEEEINEGLVAAVLSKMRSKHCNDCGRWRMKRWFSEILQLRLVCRDWEAVINNFYENLPYYFTPPEDYSDVFARSCPWTQDNFCYRPVDFLNHFKPDGVMERNPFLGRRCIIGKNNGSGQLYYVRLLPILNNYGHHIWYCTIKTTAEAVSTTAGLYRTLKSLLIRMPHLKELNIVYSGGAFPPANDQLPQLVQEINQNPMPTIRNLRRLRAEQLPVPILNEIVRRNNQVSMLQVVRRPIIWSNHDSVIYGIHLPNMKQFGIRVSSETEFQSLESSRKKWPLEILKLGIHDDADVEWPRVFKLLERKWAACLTQVSLHLPEKMGRDANTILKECGSYRLNLPNVTSFKVTMENASCLDFILPMKDNLEFLEVTKLYDCNFIDPLSEKLYHSLSKEQVIQFLGYENRLLESNIWNHFPNLKRIDMYQDWERQKRRVHLRQEWLDKIESQQKKKREEDAAFKAELVKLNALTIASE